MPSLGAHRHAAKDAPSYLVIGPVVSGAPAQVLQGPLEDALHHRDGHLIWGQAVLIFLVLAVTVERSGAILAALPLALQHVLHFAGVVPEVDLVHGKQERSHNVVVFCVEVVHNGNILDAVLREKLFGIVAGLPHFTAQPAEILDDDQVGLTLLQLF